MSYEIEYDYHAMRLSTPPDAPTRFLAAVLTGSNNTYVGKQRTRRWQVQYLGTEVQVLQQAVYFAAACEGGMCKPKGRDCAPEDYIRRIRNLLKDAPSENDTRVRWQPYVKLPVANIEAIGFLESAGLVGKDEKFYSLERRCFQLPDDPTHALFHAFWDRFHLNLAAWDAANVNGLFGEV
jgi:hypothetical protein